MSLHQRFFGTRGDDDGPDSLVSMRAEREATLQVLLETGHRLEPETVTQNLRGYHPDLADATCELEPELLSDGKILGLAGWGPHVVRLVGFEIPMPARAVETCVAPAHYSAEIKNQVRGHGGHVLLYYSGAEDDVLEQYVVLTATAAALSIPAGLAVLNEAAQTSMPASVFTTSEVEGDRLELLRTFPLLMLYCGFVKYNLPDESDVWMRTYGGHVFGLPNFAVRTSGHHEGEKYFAILGNILDYLRTSGATLAAGHTMQVGPDSYLRCRAPGEAEAALGDDHELLIVELISKADINRPRRK